MRAFPLVVATALICCLASTSAWAQELGCDPCSYDFGSIQVGKTSSYSIQLANNNTQPLVIFSKSVQGDAFSFGSFPLPMRISPYSSIELPIVFAPTASGSTQGVLELISNAQNSPIDIDVYGSGAGNSNPQLTVSPATLSFGNVTVGSSASLQATLTASNAAVTVSSDQLSNSEFAIVGLTLPVTIAAGKSISATIQFTPTATGAATGQATFTSNATNSPTVDQLSGTGVAAAKPQLSISPASLNFGNVTVGSSASLQATLTASNAAVKISSDQLSNSEFSIVGLTLPVTIAAGKSLSVTIQFTPTAAGAASGQATFTSNAANSPTVDQVSGTGVAAPQPQLNISPATLNFGNVTVGSSASLQATLTASNAAVTISSDKSTNTQYAVVGLTLPVTIAAGKSLSVTIQFTPTAAGAVFAKTRFVSNAVNSPAIAQSSGTGVANPQLSISPATLNFGKVTVGSSASLQTTLTASNAAVTISSDKSTNTQFAVVGLTLPVTIAAGKSLSVTIQFTPTAATAASAKTKFVSNAENSPTVAESSGTGVAAVNPQLSISPASLNFGNVTVGSSASLQATLTASNAAVTISSDQLSNSEFAIVGLTLPVTIAAGKSISATIQFTPTAAAAATGQATFTSNATNSPTVDQLSGTGVAAPQPQLSISPATLNFGNVTVGSSASLQATLTASNAAVTISSDKSTNTQFAVVGLTLPVTIAAGKSLSVTIQFTPTAATAASAKTKFVSNAQNSPAVEQSSGTGVAAVNPQLGISPATLSFGNVTVGSSTSLQATLTASGAAVTISSDQSSSSEFAILGLTLPVTIAAGSSVPVTIQFTPNASGTATAKTGFISNAVNSPTVDQVTGTGVAAVSHSVTLTWQPGDGNAVGYNVYRGAAQAGPFQEINTALDPSTNYTDTTVVSGTTYYYVTTEVNSAGQESAYSSAVQAVIPSP